MTALTVAQAIKHFEVEIDQHLEREISIPVVAGLQRQGDVLVRPLAPGVRLRGKDAEVPNEGVAVVRGENGGNTHRLLAYGPGVTFDFVNSGSDMAVDTNLRIGNLVVAEGSTAYLAHPEHGYLGIAPGTYEIRRQREFADTIRQVAD